MTLLKLGRHESVSESDYHALPYTSKSRLDKVNKSLRKFKYFEENPIEPTKDMLIGQALHCRILEPEEFGKRFAYEPQKHEHPGYLETVKDIKAAIEDLTLDDLRKLNDSLKSKEREAGILKEKCESDQSIIDGHIKSLDKKDFETAKCYSERVKQLKASMKKLKDDLKKHLEPIDINIKKLKDAIKEKESLSKAAKKSELIKTLLKLNPDAKIWDVFLDSFYSKLGERRLLTYDHFQTVMAMEKTLRNHPVFQNISSQIKATEVTYIWEEPETKEICKSRIDIETANGWILDLKKCRDASEQGFLKSISGFRYDTQDCFYSKAYETINGSKPKGFIFVAIEDQAPFDVGFYCLDFTEDERELIEYEYIQNIKDLQIAKETNRFKSYTTNVKKIKPASWRMYQLREKLGE